MSLVFSSDICVGSFEKHTRGIGSKLMFKMGYEGKALGKHVEGMINPILVEEQLKKFGLGYVQFNCEDSKAMKAYEATSKRNFVAGSNPQTCKVCIQDDCHCLKPML